MTGAHYRSILESYGLDYEAWTCGGETRFSLTLMEEESLADIRLKQKTHATLSGDAAATRRWTLLCDAWCAWWFSPAALRPDAREYSAIADALISGPGLFAQTA